MKFSVMAALAVVFALVSAPSDAKPRHHHKRAVTILTPAACVYDNSGRVTCLGKGLETPVEQSKGGSPRVIATEDVNASLRAFSGDPRPRAWCGWWMRHHLGVADKSYNRASQWARYGTNAHGPGVGVIVVWWHHVGIITGGSEGHWVVKSGNDGHAVQERERSLRGVIAYRWPNGVASR